MASVLPAAFCTAPSVCCEISRREALVPRASPLELTSSLRQNNDVVSSVHSGFWSGELTFRPEGSSASECAQVFMAVPKKRTSKMKTRSRKAVWLAQGREAAMKALSLGKSIASGRATSFLYEEKKAEKTASAGEEEQNDSQ
eukprot:TRINITY_DN2851_c0_g1_i2.p1 TRINITY_DN2851_c0_g1~~TRINITY_DN2851_c0_g1_i2.p1  ORF type:complete len:149 (-),score=32.62 TRINITY_DN2851_c0_g1_i2:172-597(-)